jgi:hypothetical protein
MEELGLFYGRLVYFTAVWYILWPFGVFCRHLVHIFNSYLVYFSCFGILYQGKSGNPSSD